VKKPQCCKRCYEKKRKQLQKGNTILYVTWERSYLLFCTIKRKRVVLMGREKLKIKRKKIFPDEVSSHPDSF